MPDADDLGERAAALHRQALVLDATAPSLSPRLRRLTAALSELHAGAVDAVLITVASIESARPTFEALGRWLEVLRSSALPIRLATSLADVRAAKEAGEIAAFFHFQGTQPIESDLNLLNVYHALGVRIIQFTYNARHLAGDGCTESRDAGLSDFGREAIKRMNDLRIVIDLSHCGERTSLEALEASRQPMVVTHANARALCDSPRNLRDPLISAIAAQGGVIGVCAFPAFLTQNPEPTVEHLLDHVDYLCALAGSKHVGLGLDYSQEDEDDYEYYGYDPRYYPRPPWIFPAGIRGFADMPNITAGLLRRGYSDEQIVGILGANFLRVFDRVWRGE